MNLKYTLAALAATTLVTNAAVVATTGFETTDNFAAGNNQTTAYNVTAADGANWISSGGSFSGSWGGEVQNGSLSTVIGNAGQWVTVDPSGSGGVGTIAFSRNPYTTTTANLLVQWTTDALTGSEVWATAETININGNNSTPWIDELVTVNQLGDVKLRLIIDTGGNGGASFDDVTITDYVPEPSSAALLGLGGLALLLRRRR